MNNTLLDVDWVNLSSNQDSNTFNSTITDLIMDQVNDFIPVKVITVRSNDKPWMNNNIRLKMTQRNRIHRKAKSTNSPHFWNRFRILRNEAIDLIREAKSTFIKTLENSLNDNKIPPDKWWKIAKSISNFTDKSSPIPPLVINNQAVHHPIDNAEVLNNHFINISTSSPDLQLPQTAQPAIPYSLSNINITEQDVADQINVLHINNLPGPDESVLI